MKLLIIFFLLPLQIYAQDITGLWAGFIHTTDKDLPYELAISENNGKLSGYSHTTFILNGVEEVGVKAVTIKNKKGNILVEDDALVFNDFSEGPVKRIKQLDILTLIVEDTAMMLNGTFKTNIIRNYKSITGTIQLRKIDNSQKTKIIPKLSELDLLSTLSFLQPKIKKKEVVAIEPAGVEKVKSDIPIKNEVAISSSGKIKELSPVLQSKEIASTSLKSKEPEATLQSKMKEKETTIVPSSAEEKRSEATLQSKTKEKETALVSSAQQNKSEVVLQPKAKETAVVTAASQEKKPEVILQPKTKEKETAIVPSSLIDKKPATTPQLKTKEKEVNTVPTATIKTSPSISLPQEKQKQVVATPKPETNKKDQRDTMSQSKNAVAVLTSPAVSKPTPVQASVISAAELTKRKTEMIRSVFFKSDSLLLSLYDNGEVDGDTVSVVLNGRIIIASQGLSTKAITKTIYITPDLGDSLQLVMYAENLGSIPPNTGLLVLQDGNDRYEIRFAGDFQKNSAIVLRRRRL